MAIQSLGHCHLYLQNSCSDGKSFEYSFNKLRLLMSDMGSHLRYMLLRRRWMQPDVRLR